MATCYAYCNRHGRIGPKRVLNEINRDIAWSECLAHQRNTPGPHLRVRVKISTRVISSNGNRYYRYSSFKGTENLD